ncbi:hypothetical protein Pan181_10000 [Aeoliella mucimassa]|uniref:Uncharacterized protein n=1 Tax=Aeoliella mucimassa TaxID=2527972 RepID=A0A518AJA6_9BACT|nr:hypothetical protein Pan181_10000 [Aeoliella mucimassa]
MGTYSGAKTPGFVGLVRIQFSHEWVNWESTGKRSSVPQIAHSEAIASDSVGELLGLAHLALVDKSPAFAFEPRQRHRRDESHVDR